MAIEIDNTCPICLKIDRHHMKGVEYKIIPKRNKVEVECSVCGKFTIDKSTFNKLRWTHKDEYNAVQRAIVSHKIINNTNEGRKIHISNKNVENLFNDSELLSLTEQSNNLIRYIGNEFKKTGDALPGIPVSLYSQIGSASRQSFYRLVRELKDDGVIDFDTHGSGYSNLCLTLSKGWKLFHELLTAKITENYGFLAMKFEKPELEKFVKQVLKPTIEEIGFKLHDARELAEAGIIDNLLRNQIRNSKFVIVDLTHDSYNAYWEAGYADGLGKPVIYICSEKIFNTEKTHFDTNHCTTVVWNSNKIVQFKNQMKATLERSLDYTI